MTAQKTFMKYYPSARPGTSLCDTRIHQDEKCTWEGRQIVRCPKYAREAAD